MADFNPTQEQEEANNEVPPLLDDNDLLAVHVDRLERRFDELRARYDREVVHNMLLVRRMSDAFPYETSWCARPCDSDGDDEEDAAVALADTDENSWQCVFHCLLDKHVVALSALGTISTITTTALDSNNNTLSVSAAIALRVLRFSGYASEAYEALFEEVGRVFSSTAVTAEHGNDGDNNGERRQHARLVACNVILNVYASMPSHVTAYCDLKERMCALLASMVKRVSEYYVTRMRSYVTGALTAPFLSVMYDDLVRYTRSVFVACDAAHLPGYLVRDIMTCVMHSLDVQLANTLFDTAAPCYSADSAQEAMTRLSRYTIDALQRPSARQRSSSNSSGGGSGFGNGSALAVPALAPLRAIDRSFPLYSQALSMLASVANQDVSSEMIGLMTFSSRSYTPQQLRYLLRHRLCNSAETATPDQNMCAMLNLRFDVNAHTAVYYERDALGQLVELSFAGRAALQAMAETCLHCAQVEKIMCS